MNRKKRRTDAAMNRRWIGNRVVKTQSFRYRLDGGLYWFEQPVGWTQGQGVPDVEIHGPFQTKEEVDLDQRRVLLPPDCEVIEGGAWNSEWEFPMGVSFH